MTSVKRLTLAVLLLFMPLLMGQDYGSGIAMVNQQSSIAAQYTCADPDFAGASWCEDFELANPTDCTDEAVFDTVIIGTPVCNNASVPATSTGAESALIGNGLTNVELQTTALGGTITDGSRSYRIVWKRTDRTGGTNIVFFAGRDSNSYEGFQLRMGTAVVANMSVRNDSTGYTTSTATFTNGVWYKTEICYDYTNDDTHVYWMLETEPWVNPTYLWDTGTLNGTNGSANAPDRWLLDSVGTSLEFEVAIIAEFNDSCTP